MSSRRASDLFVECLETEGVRHVFGIPGEETLDLNESLADSSVEFVPVRQEQGGAYMADMYGRLTQNAGVCLGTLGPGAMNLVTAVGDAYLDRAPLVALTGQADVERMHKESHQYIDLIELFKPITKWNARVTSPEIIPEVVRKAFKVAESEKPGATHLELPEDVMAADVDAVPLEPRAPVLPEPGARELLQAADLIRSAINPVVLAGNGVVRAKASPALREFVRATGIQVAETFMGKGLLDYESPYALGTVGLQASDYAMAGFEDADVVIAVGYDLVEHDPVHWNPRRDKRVICIDAVPAEVDGHFQPEVELIGDIYHVLSRLGEECRASQAGTAATRGGSHRLRDLVLGRFESGEGRRAVPGPAAAGAVGDPQGARPRGHADLGRRDAQAVDLAHVPCARAEHGDDRQRPGRDGLRRCPAAIAAKMVHPERKVVTVSGDGGFLMNCQELETAVRLRTPIVNVIWEDHQYGVIKWKQENKFEPSLRHRLHEPRLRQARGRLRDARLALRERRGLREAPEARARPRPPVAHRPADRLLDRRRVLRGARGEDGLDLRRVLGRSPGPSRGRRFGASRRAYARSHGLHRSVRRRAGPEGPLHRRGPGVRPPAAARST